METEDLRRELIDIKEMVLQVACGTANKDTDKAVYGMFGSLSNEKAQGVVIGITLAITALGQ